MLADGVIDRARILLRAAQSREVQLATAESCTGGLLAACLTAVPGSSDVVERGFVTYSNAAKQESLGVSDGILADHGAVSAEAAAAMARGCLEAAHANLAISVTGIAGPSGGSDAKPVGLVFLGLAARGEDVATRRHIFDGNRTAVRAETVAAALAWLEERLGVEPS